jgi:hypothetical protein
MSAPRRRGRPSKAEIAEREAALAAAGRRPEEISDQILNQKLSEPVSIGRKKKLELNEDTLLTISELAKLLCTQKEIAAVLGVTEPALRWFFEANPDAYAAWEDGQQYGKISLRRKQFALADKNAPAAIFLGKNILGQKDEHHTTTTVNRPATELSDADLMDIIQRGTKQKPSKDKSVH